MAYRVLNNILTQLDDLEPQEPEQVGRAVQERLAGRETRENRKAFHEALLASGLVREIRPPRTGPTVERPVVQVQGKPVSETLTEERR